MSDCDKALEALALRAAGEPDPASEPFLLEHLASCHGCRAESERLRAILDAMLEEPAPDPGPVYWASFQARLDRRIAYRSRSRRARALLVGLAAGALIVAGLGWLTERGRVARPSGAPTIADGGAAPEESAEARLEAALGRMAAQEAGEGEFEAILDELAPGSPLAAESMGDRAGPESSGPLDGAA